MADKDMKLPSRNYWEGFAARNEALWDKIRNNTFVNMVFPVQEVSEGNTAAILPLVVPGGLAVKTTVKTIEGLPIKTSKLVKKASRPKGGTRSYIDVSPDDFWYQLETGITPKKGTAPKSNFGASKRGPSYDDNWNGSVDNVERLFDKLGGKLNYTKFFK